MMNGMLDDFGFHKVTEAEDGLVAVEHFETAARSGEPFELVFLDIVMPVMDGQEALKRMRAIEKEAGVSGDDKATIIMATSLHSTNDMIDAIIDGQCDDYIVKPFEPEDLLGLLEKYGFVDPAEE